MSQNPNQIPEDMDFPDISIIGDGKDGKVPLFSTKKPKDALSGLSSGLVKKPPRFDYKMSERSKAVTGGWVYPPCLSSGLKSVGKGVLLGVTTIITRGVKALAESTEKNMPMIFWANRLDFLLPPTIFWQN